MGAIGVIVTSPEKKHWHKSSVQEVSGVFLPGCPSLDDREVPGCLVALQPNHYDRGWGEGVHPREHRVTV